MKSAERHARYYLEFVENDSRNREKIKIEDLAIKLITFLKLMGQN